MIDQTPDQPLDSVPLQGDAEHLQDIVSSYAPPPGEMSPSSRLVIGLLLLLPVVIVWAVVQLLPALGTLSLSFTEYNMMTPPELVGIDNYARLGEDNVFGGAFNYTVLVMIVRVVVVSLIPPLIALLVGLQGRLGRVLNWLVIAVTGALISPIALAVLWRLYWGQMWGREPSPVFPPPDWLFLGRPDGARGSTLLLDALITLAIAVVVGGIAYLLVLRGRRAGDRRWLLPFAGLWLLSLPVAMVSALTAFTIPYVLTRGGPAHATLSYALYTYQQGFQNFKFGYAAVPAFLMIVAFMLLGLLVWVVVTLLRLKLVVVPAEPAEGASRSLLSILSLPLLLVIGLLVIYPFFWGWQLAQNSNAWEDVFSLVEWGAAQVNTLAPWLVIWLVQLPVTFLAGLALGYFRPGGRRASDLIFLALLLFAFIPPEALSLQWFDTVREQELLDTHTVLLVPWLMNGVSLLIFKLFFDGVHDQYAAARREGVVPANMLTRTVLLPSLGLILLVGTVMSFASLHDVLWPLISVNSRDMYTLPVNLMMILGQFSMETAPIAGITVSFAARFLPIFALAFALLAIFVVDRLALVSGRGEPA